MDPGLVTTAQKQVRREAKRKCAGNIDELAVIPLVDFANRMFLVHGRSKGGQLPGLSVAQGNLF